MTHASVVAFAASLTALGAEPEAVWMVNTELILESLHGPLFDAPASAGLRVGLTIDAALRDHPHALRAREAHQVALAGGAGGYVIQWGDVWLHVHVSPRWEHGRITGALAVAHRTTAEDAEGRGMWGAVAEEELQATLSTDAPYRLASGRVLPAGTDVVFRPGRTSREVVAVTALSAEEGGEIAASPVWAVTLVQPGSQTFSIRETLRRLLQRHPRPPLSLVR